MRRSIDYLRMRPILVWRLIFIFLVIWIIIVRLGAWMVSVNTNSQTSSEHFKVTVDKDIKSLQDHFEYYANTLYAGQALFSVDKSVSRQDWLNFISDQHLIDRYPGVYGLSYISSVSEQDAPALLAKINGQLRPTETPLTNFYPYENATNYSVVTYVAPDSTSQSGIGYNILSDSNRSAAATKSGNSGDPTVTAHLLRLQGDPSGKPKELIIFLPVYNNKLPLNTIAERQSAVVGYVDILLHVKPLLDNIFSSDSPDSFMAVQIQSSGDNIYNYGSVYKSDVLKSTNEVVVAGQNWNVTFAASQNFGLAKTSLWLPRLLLISEIPMLALCLVVLYLGIKYQNLKKQAKSSNSN